MNLDKEGTQQRRDRFLWMFTSDYAALSWSLALPGPSNPLTAKGAHSLPTPRIIRPLHVSRSTSVFEHIIALSSSLRALEELDGNASHSAACDVA